MAAHLRLLVLLAGIPSALVAGGLVAGGLGACVAGVLMLAAVPVAGFTRNQMELTSRGREVATTVEEVRALKASDAAAFTAIFRRTGDGHGPALPPAGTTRPPDVPVPGPAGPPAHEDALGGAGPGDALPFWLRLTQAERHALDAMAHDATFPAGAVLWEEGAPADHVLIIRTGQVKIILTRAGGERLIARRGPGDIIGERAALLVRRRSATVGALGPVHAMLVSTAAFGAFLNAHPRVLSLLEHEIYQRLTGELPARGGGREHWAGQNCSILYTDIAGFGGRHRDDEDRRTVRNVMYALLRDALEHCGLSWDACHHEDRGDGVLVIAGPETPTRALTDPLLTDLAARLRQHNRRAVPATRIQLRAALDVGPVVADDAGVTGYAIINAARLLDAPALKGALAETAADLGFITSAFVYETTVRQTPGRIDPDRYQRVTVQVKEMAAEGWMYLSNPPTGRS
ncbi:cyclic nucleotide-binding domain-containing protein [Actinomadura craniellae]|uniref:cyclic nucleotide-binding domain-containing protein n=1 Tax=Actinomadura craniellae TaxID=2231787 RepID=UPI0013142AC2|nr:cyclic nucleotide-binding domain-containing protein [Actinomadura craniellae]